MTRFPFLLIAYVGLVVMTGGEIAGQSVTLSVGDVQETVDGSVVVPIHLDSAAGAQPAALQWSLSYSSDVSGVAFAAGAQATNAGKSLTCNGNTCLIYGLNSSTISDGTVATVTLQIPPHPSFLVVPLQITGVVAAGQAGDSISAASVSGSALLLPTFPSQTLNSPVSTQLPVAYSVWPSGSGGLSQTFTFVFSSAQGVTNLTSAEMLFAISPDGVNSCFILYDPNRDTITLRSDDLNDDQIKPAGSSSTIENSQCAIDATSVMMTPLATTISVGITFKSTFMGRKNVYMYAAEGDGSASPAWQQSGTYTVADPTPPLPTAESVSPNAGHGVSQTFTFVFSDSQSATNLVAAAILFAPALDVQNSCYVIYDRISGTVQLEWDNAMGADSKPVNSPFALQNSQCAIGTASVTTTANSTIIGLDIIFKSGFTGMKSVYMYGADGDGSLNTGWVQKGTWTLY
ncbi:MAG TPA: hypothetical protein VGQ49_03825 [Bryobacteraceae bacterium]|nr:hypothetical protein [Bryobacteraceae bacterium]